MCNDVLKYCIQGGGFMQQFLKIFSFMMPKGHDKRINTLIIILVVFGWFMISSASMGALTNSFGVIFSGIRQLVFIIAGYVAMVKITQFFSFELFEKFLPLIIFGTIIALLLPRLSDDISGAYAWIRLSFGDGIEFSIQPSEFAKLVIILVMSSYLGDCKDHKDADRRIKSALGIVSIFILIVLFVQNDTGSAAVMSAIAFMMLIIPRNKKFAKIQGIAIKVVLALTLAVLILMSPIGTQLIESLNIDSYQLNRFLAASNPFNDQYGSGFQLIKGLVAFATGGIQGVGYGASIQKYSNFPAADTDYIFAIIVEELGIFGMLLVFISYALLLIFLFQYALKMKEERSKMIFMGTAMYLFIHFFFNVGGVTGMIPLTGVPLLLLSAGGSSTVSFMMAIGLCQSIIRNNVKESP